MKVLCKKSYKPFFIKNNWYEAFEDDFIENNDIRVYFKFDPILVPSSIDKNTKVRFEPERFKKFFYTTKQLRKLKLKQIDRQTKI